MKSKNYYLGLDIGTDSVGYAATDESYDPIKFKGEPIMGVTTFEEGKLKDERRSFRTNRRRIERRHQRIDLLEELFCKEIAKTDDRFFIRIKESALLRKDTSSILDTNLYFCDKEYNDKHFHKQFPTIHHLITSLITDPSEHDARLVYIACSWLIAHRGHFLSNINTNNIAEVLDVTGIYNDFIDYYKQKTGRVVWHCEDISAFADILKQKNSISAKEKAFCALLFDKKMPKEQFDPDNELDQYSTTAIVKLLSGGKTEAKKLFLSHAEEYEGIEAFSMGDDQEKLEGIISALGDNGELIRLLKTLYDYGILADILGDNPYISQSKVNIYNTHKKELRTLKNLLIKYDYNIYNKVFKAQENTPNYASYIYDKSLENNAKRCSREDFYNFLKKTLSSVTVAAEDQKILDEIYLKIENGTYLPKQVNSDNRVIPHQLYYHELKKILKNASSYLDFLSDTDENGLSTSDKILSIFTFKIPYYVGPLNQNSEHSWIERKADKIYPWNFDSIVDLDKSEEAFIRRMTNKCSYLSDQNVLPKCSLAYCSFEVLNEINTIKVNGSNISVDVKQKIYKDLFEKQPKRKITKKRIFEYLLANNLIEKEDVISGVDEQIKSSLKPYDCFRNLLQSEQLTLSDVENIIERITYSTDQERVKKWLKSHYSKLSDSDVNYLSRLSFSDFGRLSKKFLCEIEGAAKDSGEVFTIMQGLWNTNNNLMMLLSDKFTFADAIQEYNRDYYANHPKTLEQRLDDMYISNSVKRQIYRTFAIVKDVIKSQKGNAPKKIFVEMTRGGTDEQRKRGRTKTRRQQIEELYKNADLDTRELTLQLSSFSDNELQRDQLYLYFTQFGRCMYSDQPIQLEQIGSKLYDIDHIYPQHFVKDDSLHNNKVLVLSEENGNKADVYPIKDEIRRKMHSRWTMLRNCNAITEEKYNRLTRSTSFSTEEKLNFINRQLVETSQATKAVATLLKEKYNDTEIVYVKAGLVSDFRRVFNLLKSRTINDLHHAKDAYLNIVVGNVYHEKFNKNYFNIDRDEYSMNTQQIFTRQFKRGECVFWRGQEDIGKTKKIVNKNYIHLTRFAHENRGGYYDQLPLKKSDSPYLIKLKSNLPTEDYGGYNKSSTAFFMLTKYRIKEKFEVMILPVDVLYSDRFCSNEDFAKEYVTATIKKILNKDALEISFPLGMRKIKPNATFSIDGFRMVLTGKSGHQLNFCPITPLVLAYEHQAYAKKIDSYLTKKKKQPSIMLSEKYDGLSKEKNIELYDVLCEKYTNSIYKKRPTSPAAILISGRSTFEAAGIEEQLFCLSQIILSFSRYNSGINLKLLGGASKSCIIGRHMNLSNWAKSAKDVRIIDSSASGLYECASVNLLSLL